MSPSDLYKAMLRIRLFEEKILVEFTRGIFSGTTHTSIGQEANAVGVISVLEADDIIVTNHRCHGHFLAYGGDMRSLFAEMMGRQTGLCGGRGGSQHIHWRNLYSNGVQGGIVPIATGMALAEKKKSSDAIVSVFIGDGTLGEGVIYEAFNMASLWKVPLLIVVENNHIAQTTPSSLALAGSIKGRFDAFNIPVHEMDSSDVQEIRSTSSELVRSVRRESAPCALILNTYRFGPHSKGDDTRSEQELQRIKATRDPLIIQAVRLQQEILEKIHGDASDEVAVAFQMALADPEAVLMGGCGMTHTVLDSLNTGLMNALEKDKRVFLLGEDILDPYGGAFKATRGCSTRYPQRVITTPISEAGLAGVCAGMALRGLRPVLEIMFGDFTTLLTDQLVNHISKFRWMYNNSVELPMVIRTPMGGRRGYGPTHSQTLEKHFLGIPGLRVLAPVHFLPPIDPISPGDLLEKVILTTHDPVLFIENKLQYLLPLIDEQIDKEVEILSLAGAASYDFFSPAYHMRVKGAPTAQVVLMTYGYMAELARQAMMQLAYDDEIFIDMIAVTQLAPFTMTPYNDHIRQAGRLVILEEGGKALGWGAEIVALTAEEIPGIPMIRVAARDLPVPAAPSLEKDVLPQVEDILRAVRKVVKL